MISNVFLYKTLRFIRIFHTDLRQYRIKSALFVSCKSRFSSLGKIRQLPDATQACSRSRTSVQIYHNKSRNCAKDSTNCRDDYCITHGHGLSRWT